MTKVLALCLIVFSNLVNMSFAEGSTQHLRDIVIGRCWDYQRQKNVSSVKNCLGIWGIFSKAFAYKDPCNTSFEDYKPYFDEVGMETVRPNKSLFWSGTYKEAHLFSDFDSRYTTLEDTMAGWIVNGLTWCGAKSNTTDGIDYSSCPKCDYFTPFWGQASLKFAEKASGIVRVLLNGTRFDKQGHPTPAYKNDSYFGKYELPNFRVKEVTHLLVLVVHSIGGADLESCGNGSIKQLQDDAKKRGINTTCYDDPDDIEHLLCADHPTSRECLFFKNKMRNTSKVTQPEPSWKGWKILAITMSAVAGVCLIAVVVLLVCKTRLAKRCFTSLPYEKQTN